VTAVDTTGHTAAEPQGRHLLLYDGVCGLCNSLVRFVLARDRHAVFAFAALQSDLARAHLAPYGATPDTLSTLYVIADYQHQTPRLLAKGRAVILILGALGWPWRSAAMLAPLPTRLLDSGYDLVARYRYRVFGRHDHCPLPQPEHRDRFVDLSGHTSARRGGSI
jgi:predicted DCC family thiol-disulfide oxidoreductase YuxK